MSSAFDSRPNPDEYNTALSVVFGQTDRGELRLEMWEHAEEGQRLWCQVTAEGNGEFHADRSHVAITDEHAGRLLRVACTADATVQINDLDPA